MLYAKLYENACIHKICIQIRVENEWNYILYIFFNKSIVSRTCHNRVAAGEDCIIFNPKLTEPLHPPSSS